MSAKTLNFNNQQCNPLGIPTLNLFFSQYFDTQPWHFQSENPTLVSELLSSFSVNELAFRYLSDWGDIRVAKRQDLNVEIAEQTPTTDLLLSNYQQGHTLVFNDLQEKIPAVQNLCRQLAQQFGCATNCNAYLTPTHGQALDLHYDDQDVYVVQLQGSKSWFVDFDCSL